MLPSEILYGWIADGLLILHFLFIFFVVGGQAVFMLGHHLRWRWTNGSVIRRTHLACVIFVVVQTWTWRHCPLTLLENRMRLAAGQEPYDGSFIAHWLERIIYIDAPRCVFLAVYTVFGALVWLFWRRRRPPEAPARRA